MHLSIILLTARPVALLAEGVDRNIVPCLHDVAQLGSPSSRRAWIEIGVPPPDPIQTLSPSSRRAWIEILCTTSIPQINHVALLAEGVDRNYKGFNGVGQNNAVALLAEGVDRNLLTYVLQFNILRRPPRGGRG